MSEEPRKNVMWPVAAAVLVACVVGIWMQQQKAARRAEAVARDLQRQNLELQGELAKLRAQPVAAAKPEALPAAVTNAPAVVAGEPTARPPRGPELVPTPGGEAPPPRSEGLVLAGAHAAPATNGIRATMRFTATTEDALGIIAVVVRLPRDGEARIVDLAPLGEGQFSDVSRRVAPDGKFAVYQGTAGKLRAIELALTVSGAAVADVRGTCGVGPLTLAISEGGAEVRQ